MSRRALGLPRSGIRSVLERAGDADVINLAAGDPDAATPGHITAAAVAALRRGATHYTHGRGLRELREAFVAKLARENNLPDVVPDTEIVITAGALNALAAAFLATVDPGERVLLPDPGFANYRSQVLLAGGAPAAYRLDSAAGFAPDLEELDVLAAGARVLVVNTPSNPTGSVFARATLEGIARIAVRHDLVVVSDEAYEHLVDDDVEHVSIASLPGMRERTLTILSLSKSWAMTGWRVGAVAGPAGLLDEIAKVQEHLIGCPPEMTQWAGVAALEGPTTEREAMAARYATRRATIARHLTGTPGVELVVPDGAFYAFPRLDVGLDGVELAGAIAAEAGVLVVPGSAFGENTAGHVRIAAALPDAALEEGLTRLTGWLRTRVAATIPAAGRAGA